MTAPFVLKRSEGMAVLREVSAAHNMNPVYVLSRSRMAPLPAIRREVAKRLQVMMWSTPQIGALLRRDHSTVVEMVRNPAARARRLNEMRDYTARRAAILMDRANAPERAGGAA